ncbi:ABC transporter substrate-binding protein [Roseomonas elaeocarpi]|uniref:ABC transporter substrate-binding protein n=1 Tax=Roseomonas elaeocarpi TaxID=907779 RepID=A0ABV6JMI8_9PROT
MRLLARVLALVLLLTTAARAQDLMIWHDKGDDGVRMIERMADVFQRENPGVRIRSLSFPTEQWFSRSIAALNTNTGPDILFNDNTRIITVQTATRRLMVMDEVIAAIPEADRRFITEGDLAASRLDGRAIMVPFQRVVAGWGIRRSWLERLHEPVPTSWADTIRVARRFVAEDPDGNGRADTFGIAMQAGNASSMLGAGVDLFVLGSGAPHPLMNENAEIVVDQPEVARPTIEYLRMFTEYRVVSPETVNHSFTDMYQIIEGGRAGMFRVLNLNVAKWDVEGPRGDYQVLPWPSFGNQPGAFVVGSVRGMAIPTASRNREAAARFVRFIVSREAQQFSLEHMGGVIRDDLDTSGVTPSMRPFLAPDLRLQTDDFLSARYPWYAQLREAYYRELIGAVSRPPADWDAFMRDTAVKMRAEVARLRAG